MSNFKDDYKGYTVNNSIHSIEDIRSIFPDGKADIRNWCFFSTSGIHGNYLDLDDIKETDFDSMLTILIVKPRICQICFGNIHVSPNDVEWLRRLAASTVEKVIESQLGNYPTGWKPPSPLALGGVGEGGTGGGERP